MEKCVQLKEKGVFAYIRGHIYNELLVKIFYPQFCHDYKVSVCYTTVYSNLCAILFEKLKHKQQFLVPLISPQPFKK